MPDLVVPDSFRSIDPAYASVTDPGYIKVLRRVAGLLGVNDPNAGVPALMTPLEIPGGEVGGLVGALAAKFPRFANAIKAYHLHGEAPAPIGSGRLADTIVPAGAGTYELRPQTEARLAHFFKAGDTLPTTANWDGVTDELLQAFGGDKDAALRWSRLWGATSPNTSVPNNTRESISALIHGLEQPGVPLTVPAAQALGDAKITLAPAKVPNINRAFAGQPLSGDKVEAMAEFMTGQPRIPIDVHALHAVGSAADKFQPEIGGLRQLMTQAEGLPARGSLSDTQIYLRYEQALRDSLQSFDPQRSLNDIFATTWEGTRALKGLPAQGGPIDILRKKGLLELGAMLDPERLRATLKTAGWTAGAISGLLASLPAEQPAPASTP